MAVRLGAIRVRPTGRSIGNYYPNCRFVGARYGRSVGVRWNVGGAPPGSSHSCRAPPPHAIHRAVIFLTIVLLVRGKIREFYFLLSKTLLLRR